MKVADRSGAAFAVVLAPGEAARREVSVKDLRSEEGAQVTVPREQVAGWLRLRLEEGSGA
jgi:histidyl-tRNA synthetase